MAITAANPFKGRHYPGELILLCVRWYLRVLERLQKGPKFSSQDLPIFPGFCQETAVRGGIWPVEIA